MADDDPRDQTLFRRSRYSTTGNCVEVGFRSGGGVLVRNSHDHRNVVMCHDAAWSRFVVAVRSAGPIG